MEWGDIVKKVVFFFLLVFLAPLIVFAKEDSNSNSIEISSLEVINKSNKVVEKSSASIQNNQILLDLKMEDVGDYIYYQFHVDNQTNEDFVFQEDTVVSPSSYFKYSFQFEDGSNVIPAQADKDVFLTVVYKNKVEEDAFQRGFYQEDQSIVIPLTDTIKNPYTGDFLIKVSILFLLLSLIIVPYAVKRKRLNALFAMAMVFAFLPTVVLAVEQYQVDIRSKIEIVKNVESVSMEKDSILEEEMIEKIAD